MGECVLVVCQNPLERLQFLSTEDVTRNLPERHTIVVGLFTLYMDASSLRGEAGKGGEDQYFYGYILLLSKAIVFLFL